MAYKSIVVAASGAAEDFDIIAAAAGLAVAEGGHLRVVAAFADTAADYANYGVTMHPSDKTSVLERIRAGEAEVQAKLEANANDAAARSGLGADALIVEKRELSPAAALSAAATLADLAVFGAESVRQHLGQRALFAETLLNTRAPILLLRAGAAFAMGGDTAIAWDGSGQAGRAVRAALPALARARNVVVLTNTDELSDAPSAPAFERLKTYLALHGIANVTFRAVNGASVAASLLDAAIAAGCGVLAAGAYGRPRLLELALGGATRALVNAEHGPHLLLAH